MEISPFQERIKTAQIEGGYQDDDYWVWCGSATQDKDGLFHLFASRWPKQYPMFNGYVLFSEIVRAISERAEGPYNYVETILPSSMDSNWDGRMAHNPTIHRFKDKYYLYYIGSTYDGPAAESLFEGKPPQVLECYENIRIGVLEADDPAGPWSTCEEPALEPDPSSWDSIIVTNPAPCMVKDEKVYLYYRSNTADGCRIGLAIADHPLGPYSRVSDKPVLTFPGDAHVEDPYVWYQGDHFEMLAKDLTGNITGEKHAGVHLWSDNGINWQLVEPCKAYSRSIQWDDGSVTTQGCLERPQILFDDKHQPICLFAATADGPGGFGKADNTWNMAVPLFRPDRE